MSVQCTVYRQKKLKTLEFSLEVCGRSTHVLPLLGLNLSLAKTNVARPSSSFPLFMSNGVNICLPMSPGNIPQRNMVRHEPS